MYNHIRISWRLQEEWFEQSIMVVPNETKAGIYHVQRGQTLWDGSHDWNLTYEQNIFLIFGFQILLLNSIDCLDDLKWFQDDMLYVDVQGFGSMCEQGINAPTCKSQTIWGWPHGWKNLFFCRKYNCKVKFGFDYQCYWSFDVWKIVYAWNRFKNLWLIFFMTTSHVNCMLVCNTSEEIWGLKWAL